MSFIIKKINVHDVQADKNKTYDNEAKWCYVMSKVIMILLISTVYSCTHPSESKINYMVSLVCFDKDHGCVVSLKDLIVEDWDYVLISNEAFSLKELNDQLGFEYPYFADIGNRIIFVKGEKIIYHEDEFLNPDDLKEKNVFFNFENNNYMKIERNNAVFKVVKDENNYYLSLM